MSDQAVERGPNYDWKHEADHYRTECDKLRELLCKMEASNDRLDEYAKGLCERQSLAHDRAERLESQLQESRALLERADMIFAQFYGTVTFYGMAKEAKKTWYSDYEKLKARTE